ncbi:MAG: ThiF family adenylyltransferase, partial [Polyangiaceae bacterium]|nr:ThiF family adenylyltransferase [Polyangiaceae bacterium]
PPRPLAARILLVGAGGVGAPAAWALARAGVARLTVLDDDRVELSNLHRQILFRDDDLGAHKAHTLAARLRELGVDASSVDGRALPETALDLVAAADVVIDGVDNFPSRFLLADAAWLTRTPIVHAAAVRWHATMWVSSAEGRPCYRCLFEDVPRGPAPDCASAGVVGPVCGVVGGLAADAALGLLDGREGLAGTITTLDGRAGELRRVAVRPRADCPLCGTREIHGLEPSRYLGPVCDA